MRIHSAAFAAALLLATVAAACSPSPPVAQAADPSDASSTERAATLSVTAFGFSGWHDESFHYLPALSVTAPATGRSVSVQRVDFTADEAGTRRLLKGLRYAVAQRVPSGGTVELVSDAAAAEPLEIASPLALASISAIIFFADDDGRTGIVSATAKVPDVPARASIASLVVQRFTIGRRTHQGRFHYWPQLTLTETSGRSRASIKKIVFELLDGVLPVTASVWRAVDVPAGDAIHLVTGHDSRAPWFEIESSREAARVSVTISFVDDAGRGGRATATATVGREELSR